MAFAVDKLKHNLHISDFILYNDLIFILKRQQFLILMLKIIG